MAGVEIGVCFSRQDDWDRLLASARSAEEAGFDVFWVQDHLLGYPKGLGILEAWTALTAVAMATERIDLGVFVVNNNFRPPGLLAKMATTFDHVSGGRLRFMIGAGWMGEEHREFGYDWPPGAVRAAELADSLVILRGLFDSDGAPFTHEGEHASVRECVNVPPPTRRIPIGVAARGPRMLELTARHADEWNCLATSLHDLPELSARLDADLDRIGRPRTDVRRSVEAVLLPGIDTFAGSPFHEELGLHGSRQQMVDRAGELADLGIDAVWGLSPSRAPAFFDAMADVLPDLRAIGP